MHAQMVYILNVNLYFKDPFAWQFIFHSLECFEEAGLHWYSFNLHWWAYELYVKINNSINVNGTRRIVAFAEDIDNFFNMIKKVTRLYPEQDLLSFDLESIDDCIAWYNSLSPFLGSKVVKFFTNVV